MLDGGGGDVRIDGIARSHLGATAILAEPVDRHPVPHVPDVKAFIRIVGPRGRSGVGAVDVSVVVVGVCSGTVAKQESRVTPSLVKATSPSEEERALKKAPPVTASPTVPMEVEVAVVPFEGLMGISINCHLSQRLFPLSLSWSDSAS